MSYRDFTISSVYKALGLNEQRVTLFDSIPARPASAWLRDTLDRSLAIALSSSSEKARSEFIIAPVLLEMQKHNPDTLAIYSGERLDADEQRGLNGECDFILSKGPLASTMQAPIFAIVEAKKNDIKTGLGQCMAQLVGAQIFNSQAETGIEVMYGCVTTGEDWQFMQLKETTVYIDTRRYYINELDTLLGVLQIIIDN